MSRLIVKASENDLFELSVLFDQYRQFYKMKPSLKTSTNFIQARLSQQDSLIFLSIQSGVVEGFAQLYPSFSSVAMRSSWTLNDLFVNSQSRRSGVARSLLNYILKEARLADIFTIKLATAKDNIAAKSLYESFDFQLNEKFDNYSMRP